MLLEPVVRSLPGQGIKKGEGKLEGKRADADDLDDDECPPPLKRGQLQDSTKRKCMVCKKKHFPYRPMPEDFRKKTHAAQKDKKAEAKSKSAAAKNAAE